MTHKRPRSDTDTVSTRVPKKKLTLAVQQTDKLVEYQKLLDAAGDSDKSEQDTSESQTEDTEAQSSDQESENEVSIYEGLKRSPTLRYQLHEKIGKGAFGSVYFATDTKTGREVAIKKIAFEPDAGLSQMQELKILQVIGVRCASHHIVCVHDHFTWENTPGKPLLYIVMSYIPGKDVRVFNAMKPTEQDQLSMATQLFSALQFLHSLGISHRDIKPDNMIWHNGHLTLVDFGLACQVPKCRGREDGTRRYTWPGLRQVKKVTQNMFLASDLYAAAKTVFELVDARIKSSDKLDRLANLMKDVMRRPQEATAESALFKIKSIAQG